MTTPEEDEAWRLIVDHYDETAVRDPEPSPTDAETGPDPDAPESLPDVDPAVVADVEEPAPALPRPAFPVEEPPTATPLQEEDEDRFVPPLPPPAPPVPTGRRVAWATVLGVPLLFFLTALTGRTIPPGMAGLLAVGLVTAFVYLVATLPREPRDPWDDGSRI